MGKYDFIKTGNLLYWHDPDNGLSDGAYRVISAPENMEDDSIILISFGSGGFAFGIITDKYGQKSQRGFFALESGT